MIVICTVNDCPWKITCRVVGASHLVQVHTFINEHMHTIDDLVSTQPLMMSFDVHPNTCHEKFVKTSFGNMGCV